MWNLLSYPENHNGVILTLYEKDYSVKVLQISTQITEIFQSKSIVYSCIGVSATELWPHEAREQPPRWLQRKMFR